jgi:hypothetical protein
MDARENDAQRPGLGACDAFQVIIIFPGGAALTFRNKPRRPTQAIAPSMLPAVII